MTEQDLRELRAAQREAIRLGHRWPADRLRPKVDDLVVIGLGEYKNRVGRLSHDKEGWETVEVRLGCLAIRYYRNTLRKLSDNDPIGLVGDR